MARETAADRELEGCWHYDYEMFCTQCDLASYGACEPGCRVNHEHCTCPADDRTTVEAGECAVHPGEDDDD